MEDAVSGAKIALDPCFLALAVTHLPLCLWGGRALNGSWLALLWYSLGHNPLFSEHTWGHCAVLEPIARKVLFLFVSLAIKDLGCYVTLAPSDVSQDIQASPYPKGQ